MHMVVIALAATWSLSDNRAEPVPVNVAAHLLLFRNPDYGAIADEDVRAAQDCKDKFLSEISRSPRPARRGRKRPFVNLSSPTYQSAIIVAAAVNVCLAAKRIEGVHAAPSEERLLRPLLR